MIEMINAKLTIPEKGAETQKRPNDERMAVWLANDKIRLELSAENFRSFEHSVRMWGKWKEVERRENENKQVCDLCVKVTGANQWIKGKAKVPF